MESLDELEARFAGADAILRSSNEHVLLVIDKVSEQSKQLIEKVPSSSGYLRFVVVHEQELDGLLAEVRRLTKQPTNGKGVRCGAHIALSVHETGSQERVSAHSRNHEMLLADKTVVETEFKRFGWKMLATVDMIQPSLNGETRCVIELDCKCIRLIVLENNLKHQSPLKSENGQINSNLNRQLDGTVAKSRLARNIIYCVPE